jgi:hypothetical protein
MKQGDWKWKALKADSGGSGRQLLNLFEESSLMDEELLAREVIQNSKDSAATLRRMISEGKIEVKNSENPRFKMEFEQVELSSKSIEGIWDLLGLSKLRKFLENSLSNKQSNSKVPQPKLLDKNKMTMLKISDFGCTGLGGDLNNPKISNYFRALISIGITGGKQANSGGTRGYGKSAFVAGSGVFTVFAYAKFPPENNYAATRHFGGVVYTFDHTDNVDLTGIGTFGDPKAVIGEVIAPLTDADADAYAKALNLPSRDGDDAGTYGTTIVIMCPTVNLVEVIEATEKYWWPAILDGELEVDFKSNDFDGVKVPQPKSRIDLTPYFSAYDLAKKDREAIPPYEFAPIWPSEDRTALNKEADNDGPNEYSLGNVGYKIDIRTGFVDPETIDDESTSTNSWVALIRSTGMVINYEELKFRKDPVVHGVMIASSESEGILQSVEPPSHNRWFPHKKSPDSEIGKMLTWIEERLKKDIRDLKKKVQIPDDLKRKRIEILSKAFGEVFKTKGKGALLPPASPKQTVHISWQKKAQLELGANGGNSRRFRSKIKVKVDLPAGLNSEDEQRLKNPSEYEIGLSAHVVEDESVMNDALSTTWIGANSGFTIEKNGSLKGLLIPGKSYEFESVTQDVGLVRVMVTASVKMVDSTALEVDEDE